MAEDLLKAAQERTDAVNKMMNAGKGGGVFTPEEYAAWEKRATMTPVERMKELAQDNSPYKDSKLQQRFTAIKSIKAVNGGILVTVDEENSRKAAVVTAFKVLGPHAKEEEFKTYVAEHSLQTTLFPIKKFIRNLRNLTLMVAQAPEYFGETTGGGEVRDLLKEGIAAVKEARAYLYKNRDTIPPGIYEIMMGGDFKCTEKKDFSNYLGEGWEKVAIERDRIEAAKRLTALVQS